MPSSAAFQASRLGDQLRSGASLSGHERDHVFLNRDGEDYVEVSGVSGLDHPGDSRTYATLDYDRDGWQDIALVSANAPLFQLYRNRMGEREDASGGFIAVRFEGGNRRPAGSDRWSNRDGYGARVLLEIGARSLLREHRAGEGFGAQNSATLHVGIGDADRTGRLRVRWPSGVTHDTTAVPDGTLVTAYENPSDSPTGEPFVLTPYEAAPTRSVAASTPAPAELLRPAHQVLPGDRADLVLYTTVATWCVPCLDELPALRLLRETFDAEELEIFGVQYDGEETLDQLHSWSDLNDPPYRILTELSAEQRAAVIDRALEELRVEGVPTAIVTDSRGEVLLVRWGPPSISELRVLLEGLGDDR